MVAEKTNFTHLDRSGAARMVNIGQKPVSERMARAGARISMSQQTLQAILSGKTPKGDVIAAARIAGIMAAKKTHELIPLCHPLSLNAVEISFEPAEGPTGFLVTAEIRLHGKTGAEMEALTACSVACLTLYDMVKSVERDIEISSLRLLEKSGGKSGHWKRD